MRKYALAKIVPLLLLCLILCACGAQGSVGSYMAQRQNALYFASPRGVYSVQNGEAQRIASDYAKCAILSGDWLYFISYELADTSIPYPYISNISAGNICRMNLSTFEVETIYRSACIDSIAIVNGRILFSDAKGDAPGRLCSVAMDGTDLTVLAENCSDFVQNGSDLYLYEAFETQPSISRLSLEDGTITPVYEGVYVTSYLPYIRTLYVVNYDAQNIETPYSIHAIDENGKDVPMPDGLNAIWLNSVVSGWLYYDAVSTDGKMDSMRLNLKTNEVERLAEGILRTLVASENYVLCEKELNAMLLVDLNDSSSIDIQ